MRSHCPQTYVSSRHKPPITGEVISPSSLHAKNPSWSGVLPHKQTNQLVSPLMYSGFAWYVRSKLKVVLLVVVVVIILQRGCSRVTRPATWTHDTLSCFASCAYPQCVALSECFCLRTPDGLLHSIVCSLEPSPVLSPLVTIVFRLLVYLILR